MLPADESRRQGLIPPNIDLSLRELIISVALVAIMDWAIRMLDSTCYGRTYITDAVICWSSGMAVTLIREARAQS